MASVTIMAMLLVSFFSWWYGTGWLNVARSFEARMKNVSVTFSVAQLLRTLFAPWRRIISYPGASLAERFRAWGDNLVSRIIGFVVRLIVLVAAAVFMLLIGIITLIELIIWPLIPLAVPAGLIAGIL